MNRAVVACLLALLAGCGALPVGGGGTGAGTETETVTPAPIPEGGTFPPGVSAEGVEDPTALAGAHVDAIDDRSYTLATEREVRYENGSLHSRLSLEVALAADRSYLAEAATAGPHAPVFLGRPPASAVFWSNGSVYVRKFTHDNATTYNEFETTDGGAGTWAYWVSTVPFGGGRNRPETFYRDLFRSVSTRTVERRTINGTTVYRLVGTGVQAGGFDTNIENIRTLRLEAGVTQAGLVRSLSLRYVGDIDGDPVEVEWTVRYRGLGTTTVERPDWFDRAV